MTRDLQYFIVERAKHLAIVYLTRNPGVAVEWMKTDYGLDILVTILQDQLPTGRVFGIQIKGQDKAIQDIQTAQLPSLSQSQTAYFQDLPFPVCQLLFTMEDDKGYYAWMKAPWIVPKTVHSFNYNHWHSLDEYPINQMITDVNTWYDEKRHSAA